MAGNISTVQRLSNGQFIVTIPRGIASAMGLEKGDLLAWIFKNGEVVIRKL